MNVAVLLSVLTSARSRGSHADVAERKSHSATMHTNTMMSAFVVRMFTVSCRCAARALLNCLPRCGEGTSQRYWHTEDER